jgi:hypothetical protein
MLIITLVNLILYLALFGLVYYLIAKFIPMQPPIPEIIRIVVVVVLVLVIIGVLFKIPGLSIPILLRW